MLKRKQSLKDDITIKTCFLLRQVEEDVVSNLIIITETLVRSVLRKPAARTKKSAKKRFLLLPDHGDTMLRLATFFLIFIISTNKICAVYSD